MMNYTCYRCKSRYAIDMPIYRCACGGFLRIQDGGIFTEDDLKEPERGVWRYKKSFFLPDGVLPVTLGEGNTPLLEGKIDGRRVYFKLDFLQPSGSFKDRGASVLISLLNFLNIRNVVEDSSGNAGSAISAYAAAAGIHATVYVPDYTPDGKVVQMKLYGARVIKVPGKRQDANEAVLKASTSSFYASHLWQPYFIMGLKSTAYEIWENMCRALPPTIIVPVGSGGLLEGLYLGFESLADSGYTKGIPKLIGVQASRCAPIHTAFLGGLNDYADIEAGKTVAEGIAVQKPPRAGAVLSALRKSRGYTVTVEEEEIVAAAGRLSAMGLFVEPTSASTLAAWLKVEENDREGAVIILTGSGLKAISTYSTMKN